MRRPLVRPCKSDYPESGDGLWKQSEISKLYFSIYEWLEAYEVHISTESKNPKSEVLFLSIILTDFRPSSWVENSRDDFATSGVARAGRIVSSEVSQSTKFSGEALGWKYQMTLNEWHTLILTTSHPPRKFRHLRGWTAGPRESQVLRVFVWYFASTLTD
jgi:hypothetical protein